MATKNGEIPREPENVIFQHYLSGLIYSADFRTSGPKSHSPAQVLVPIQFCRQLVQGGHAAENHLPGFAGLFLCLFSSLNQLTSGSKKKK